MKIFQNSTACTIGGRAGSSTAGDYLFDGYMAEYCWCDGQVLNADNFGQIDTTTNNWVPKDVSGLTFGNNGFYLNFADKNDLGDDESGNTNDWTESGFDTTNGSNQYHDTPTRNFATFDPYQIGTTSTSVEDCMLHFTSSASGTHEQAIRSTFQNPKTGKWYAEFEVFNVSGYPAIIPFVSTEYNVQQANFDVSAADYGIRINASGGFMVVLKNIAETNMTATGWSYSTGDVVQVAIDCDNDRFYMGVNDSWNAELGGDPDDSGAGTYFPFSTIDGTLFNASSYASRDVTVNFGQWQYFDATDLSETSGAKGFFRFTPPTGFKACNNDNMKDVDSYQTGFQWTKNRDSTDNHMIFDRVRGPYKDIHFNTGSAEVTNYNTLQRFLKQGHEIGEDVEVNSDQEGFIGWNWFIETTGSGTSNTTGSLNTTRTLVDANAGISVGLYDGNSTAGATVGHGLGKAPKMVIINEVSGAETPFVGHEGATIAGGAASWHYGIYMSSTAAPYDLSIYFNDTAPTSTEFSLGDHTDANGNGKTFVAYLFAHNNDDGGFGEPGDQDIIKCASYTSDGGTGTEINVGFEPQFLMIKRSSGSGNWMVFDAMRGVVSGAYPNLDNTLFWDLNNAERTNTGYIGFTPTGFVHQGASGDTNTNGETYVYMAIRRGGMQTPTAASDVFHVNNYSGNSNSNLYNTGFNVDMNIHRKASNTSDTFNLARLIGSKNLYINTTGSEDSNAPKFFEPSNVLNLKDNWWGTQNDIISWSWKRAPSYFDVVAYTGTGSNRTITHNLGVVPEMMWLKERSGTFDWNVYHKDLGGADKYLKLNGTDAVATATNRFNNTHPTASVFSLGTSSALNDSGATQIAYLFASVAGVSKVGSVAPTGSALTVDCGFSNGARFVLMKRTDSTGEWFVWDSVRGIVSGNDPWLALDSTSSETTNTDYIDPHSSGFTLTSNFYGSGSNFIFYAIA